MSLVPSLGVRGELLCLVARIALSRGAPPGDVLTVRLAEATQLPDAGDGLARQQRRYLIGNENAIHLVDLIVCTEPLDGEANDRS